MMDSLTLGYIETSCNIAVCTENKLDKTINDLLSFIEDKCVVPIIYAKSLKEYEEKFNQVLLLFSSYRMLLLKSFLQDKSISEIFPKSNIAEFFKEKCKKLCTHKNVLEHIILCFSTGRKLIELLIEKQDFIIPEEITSLFASAIRVDLALICLVTAETKDISLNIYTLLIQNLLIYLIIYQEICEKLIEQNSSKLKDIQKPVKSWEDLKEEDIPQEMDW